jgi:endonuclease III
MTLGQILGGESKGPQLTAVLQSLGRSVCTPESPRCGKCPARTFCASRN